MIRFSSSMLISTSRLQRTLEKSYVSHISHIRFMSSIRLTRSDHQGSHCGFCWSTVEQYGINRGRCLCVECPFLWWSVYAIFGLSYGFGIMKLEICDLKKPYIQVLKSGTNFFVFFQKLSQRKKNILTKMKPPGFGRKKQISKKGSGCGDTVGLPRLRNSENNLKNCLGARGANGRRKERTKSAKGVWGSRKSSKPIAEESKARAGKGLGLKSKAGPLIPDIPWWLTERYSWLRCSGGPSRTYPKRPTPDNERSFRGGTDS